MYLFLLLFGVLLTATGSILAASGVSIHDRLFDPTLVSPGVIIAIGGLLLIGLGLVVQVLQRIERALVARPMPRAVRPGDGALVAPAITTASELPGGPPRIPFPPKPESHPQVAPAAAAMPSLFTEDKAFEQLREKFQSLARLEIAPGTEEKDVVTLPAVPDHAHEDSSEPDIATVAIPKNGAAPGAVAPRLALNPRPTILPERPKTPKFNALWPRGPRPARDAQPAHEATPAAPLTEPEQSSEPAADVTQMQVRQEMPVPVSILKSGTVDGMAYTLFSDGSIEAELPQGTLRFGSITELRNHIEQNA